MRIALLQLRTTVGDVAGNTGRVLDAARRAHRDGARLAVAPELALLGYPAEDLVARDDVLDQVEAHAAWLAAELDHHAPGLALVVGLPARSPATTTVDALPRTRRNRAVVIHRGQVVHAHDKVALPDYGVFDETRHFAPGPDPGGTVTLELGDDRALRLGVVVCEDLWSTPGTATPPADAQAAAGAELIVAVNASPWHLGKPAARLATVRAVAARTGVPVAYANMVGATDDLLFDGRSCLVWPDGHALHAAAWQEQELVVDLADRSAPGAWAGPDPATLATTSATPAAALTDHELADVWCGLRQGLVRYAADCGFDQVVLGCSGGIDSAVVAALATDALGPDAVLGLALPSPWSSRGSVADARELARRCGFALHQVAIASMMAATEAALDPLWQDLGADTGPDVTEENVQARLRGLLLMAVSNRTGRMLLTTGNKSEGAVGYATLYGDMAGGYAPLVDLPKGLVYALARWRNRTTTDVLNGALRPAPIPPSSIDKPPSAELAPDQLDTDALPDYELLDELLAAFVERGASRDDLVAAGHDPDVVDRVCTLVLRAEYKRRQAPPGPKVTALAFLRDRRFPIASRWQPAAPPPQHTLDRGTEHAFDRTTVAG